MIVAHAPAHVEDLLVALLGGAPHLEIHEEVDDLVVAVGVDLVVHLRVVLVALGRLHVLVGEPVVVEHAAEIATDPSARLLAGALRVGIAERPARGHRGKRLHAVDLAVERVVLGQLLGHLFPRLLRNDEDAHAELGHDLHRLGGDGGGIGAAAKALEGRGPDVRARLADELAVELAVTLLQSLQQHLGVLDEALAALAHGHAEPVELDLARPAPEAQDHPAARDVVEHGDFFGHPHGIVPGQHDDHRAQGHPGGAPRHVGEELQHVGAHGVVGKVVLDAPDGVETQWLAQIGEPEIILVDVEIPACSARVLEDGGHADSHSNAPPGWTRRPPRPANLAPPEAPAQGRASRLTIRPVRLG